MGGRDGDEVCPTVRAARPEPRLTRKNRTPADKQKDELVLEGNNIENVSGMAAAIHDSCLVRNKDLRKFLDGLYVSSSGIKVAEE